MSRRGAAVPGRTRRRPTEDEPELTRHGAVEARRSIAGWYLDLLVDFEPGTSLLDHVGLFQDLEELLGVGVDVVARSALKPRDEHIRAEAVDL